MKPTRQLHLSPFYGLRAAQTRGPLRLLLKFFPLHLLTQVRFEFAVLVHRFRHGKTRRQWKNQRDLLVNLGCGGNGRADWVNLDAFPAPGVNCVCDCRRGLPFADASCAGIFTEHFFEHVDYTEEVPRLLDECHRILVPGGVIRIVVPDSGRYLQNYALPGWDGISRLRGLSPDHDDPYSNCRFRTKMEVVNEIFRQGTQHKYAYDEATLSRVLLDAGFTHVTVKAFGESADARLILDQAGRAHESLFVEGSKG
jgi:predicted SAM-dependent methyltransferase